METENKDINSSEPETEAELSEVMEISERLMKRNKAVYEELAK